MKDDQEEAFEKILSRLLSRNIDFVKFAETKNAVLLTFSSAWIIGSINLLTGQSTLPLGYNVAFCVALPLFALAGLVSILSFTPQVLERFYQPADNAKSLLYWEHIADIPVGRYHKRVTERYKPGENHSVTERYLDDLCVQISVNARVATRKFTMFNIAAGCVFAAILVLDSPPLWWGLRLLQR
ncbi:Pycsar system effector family protein [Bradyrhizobium sp. STM 3561]|uniref:Pycsar system effector family protein n=1 Tax=Bradyrhizobium sp. STM 3561 TaxID=578923 RepID=UPI00388FD3B1